MSHPPLKRSPLLCPYTFPLSPGHQIHPCTFCYESTWCTSTWCPVAHIHTHIYTHKMSTVLSMPVCMHVRLAKAELCVCVYAHTLSVGQLACSAFLSPFDPSTFMSKNNNASPTHTHTHTHTHTKTHSWHHRSQHKLPTRTHTHTHAHTYTHTSFTSSRSDGNPHLRRTHRGVV